MKTHLAIFSLGWKRALAYRGIGIIYVLLSLMNIFLSLAVWSVAYRNPLLASRQSFTDLVQYFFFVIFFSQIAQSFAGGAIADEHIKRGELSNYLLKPFSYMSYTILIELPWRLLAFLMSLPALLILVFLFGRLFSFDPGWVMVAVILVIPAYILSFLLQILFAGMTFWFEDSHGMFSVLEIATLLFSGLGIPVFLFPPILKSIGTILPFQYILYFPVSAASSHLSPTQFMINILIMGLWIAGLAALNRILWTRGLKKFTGEGI